MTDPFREVYRTNAWNGRESLSGPGSGTDATKRVAPEIVGLVEELGVRSVLDVGCGDGFWMPDLPGYVGIDVVPEAIRRARKRHPHREYRVSSIDRVPHAFDLVIVRDVIQHMGFAGGLAVLSGIRATDSRWLLASTYVGGENVDIVTGGGAYSPDLSVPPFDLGDPVRYIFDGFHYHETDEVRDASKHLGLWSLR